MQKLPLRCRSCFLTLLTLATTLTAAVWASDNESVVYTLGTGNIGMQPNAGLVADKSGNLYGATSSGGLYNFGTIFELSPASDGWKATTLYAFAGGSDGATPMATLSLDAEGNLYGTTQSGGGGVRICTTFVAPGCGTVFKLTRPSEGNPDGKWTKTVLHAFGGCADGAYPVSTLISDAQGNLYGTAAAGGGRCGFGNGIVFKLTPSQNNWTETVLHRFVALSDGAIPLAGLVRDPAGNLYGTTGVGGPAGCGTVFALSPSAPGWTESFPHTFECGLDGNYPTAKLIFDASGNLYGTTAFGGVANQDGNGTVFELTASATGWIEIVLHRFITAGAGPFSPVTLDSQGQLYGTTDAGGTYAQGTVFKLTKGDNGDWNESALYNFTGGSDGGYPLAGVVWGESGALYGTTYAGGYEQGFQGDGVVFAVNVN